MSHDQRRLRLLLLSISSLLSLALLEVGLRLALGTPPQWRSPQESYVTDAETAHRLLPDQQAYTHHARVETNEHGLRDQHFAPVAPEGRLRVLALGDSQTFGNGLEIEETWPKQLEAALRQADGDARWEVLNGGIASTDTWQHAIFLRRYAALYSPDVVALAIYVNDIQRAYRPPTGPEQVTGNSATRRFVRFLKRTALVSGVLQATRTISGMIQPSRGMIAEQHMMSGEPDEVVAQAWAQVDRSIGEMAAFSRSEGITFVICVLPRRDQVAGALVGSAYQARLAEIGARHGVPVVDALKPLQHAYAKLGAQLFIPWDGHNSAKANAVIADEIAMHIRSPLEAKRDGVSP